MAEEKEPSLWVLIVVWLLSLGLLVASYWGGGGLGGYRVILSLGIATAMLLLQYLYYMRLWYRRGMLRIVAMTGYYWLALLFGLMLADYLNRHYVPPPWKNQAAVYVYHPAGGLHKGE